MELNQVFLDPMNTRGFRKTFFPKPLQKGMLGKGWRGRAAAAVIFQRTGLACFVLKTKAAPKKEQLHFSCFP